MPFKMYNTLTRKTEIFEPIDTKKVLFYSCGPTVYDDAHIGNFRSFLAADLLRRWIESPLCAIGNRPENHPIPGRAVLQIMNITDVGHMTEDDSADGAGLDKMELAAQRIKQAKKAGRLPPESGLDPDDPRQVARFYEQRFKEDAIALGLKVAIDDRDRKPGDPVYMPRATDNIEQMKRVIEDLLAKGCAYPAGTPGARAVYFDVQKFTDYGQLSGNSLDNLRGGAGGRVDQANQSEKRHPADFLLWKEDAAHKMKWDSPKVPGQDQWGQGYPGWHIECTAMALGALIPGGLNGARTHHARIDLHSGGEDNIFPHHECEIAQSRCFTGADAFANYWFHPRFLKVDGQKMSKSKGTMYTLRDLTEKGFDPAAVRLELIKTHYRANADFSMQGLKDSARMIDRWKKARYEIARRSRALVGFNVRKAAYAFHNLFMGRMDDDLNIAGAIGEINRNMEFLLNKPFAKSEYLATWSDSDIEAAWEFPLRDGVYSYGSDILDIFRYVEPVLGVLSLKGQEQTDTGIALYQPGVSPSEEIESLLTQRADAKKAKDFAAADAIRDQLTAMGLSIMDKPGGQVEVAPLN